MVNNWLILYRMQSFLFRYYHSYQMMRFSLFFFQLDVNSLLLFTFPIKILIYLYHEKNWIHWWIWFKTLLSLGISFCPFLSNYLGWHCFSFGGHILTILLTGNAHFSSHCESSFGEVPSSTWAHITGIIYSLTVISQSFWLRETCSLKLKWN